MERLKTFYEREKDKLSGLSVTSIMREKLVGFDPSLLDNEDELEETYPEDEGLDSFLNQVAELKKNTALPKILAFLTRNQILWSVKKADSLEAMNFGRASVNGVELVREEIDRLEALRLERSGSKEEFDKHEVI